MSDYTRASLELLYNVSRELTSALDLHTVLTRMLFLSTTNVQAERGSVIVVDEKQQPVDAAIVYEGLLMPVTVEQMQSTLEQGLAGWVVRNRQSAFVPDTSQDPRWLRRPDDDKDHTGPKSSICVPIMVRDNLVGVLTMVHATPGFFDKDHLALLTAIADQAGIAIQNARLYESLQATQRRYRELFEDSIDPILVTNLEGTIIEANRQVETVSGRPRDTLKGSSVWMLTGESARLQQWLQEHMPNLQDGETVNCETEFSPPDHTPIPVEIYVHRIHFEREELLQWIIRDISARKQLDTLRDDLAAMIYHDLRSPLANIVSSLDMLRALIPDPNSDVQVTQQVLTIAIRSSERLQRLINSLLDINRLEAGQPITSRRAADVQAMVREAVDAVTPVTSTKRQQVQVNLPEHMPKIWVDEDMIRRVLINLLENATKFTPAEGTIVIGGKLENDWMRLWVKDSGPGIPAESQEMIFNKFSRLQIEKSPKGLGLGLAFCKLAVQAHGGKIGIESEPGDGSCFYFTVPVVKE